MIARFRFVSLLAAANALFACTSSSTPAAHPAADANGCPSASANGCAPAKGEHDHARAMGQHGADCPMATPGTSVRAVDVEGGVALEFVTSGDVALLQRRVAHMAEMHANHGAGRMRAARAGDGTPDAGNTTESMQHDAGATYPGMMGGGMMGGGMMGGGMMGGGMMGGGMMAADMMAADARAEQIPGGARLVFTPKTPAELESLRRHVHEHAERPGGRCPMMELHQHGES